MAASRAAGSGGFLVLLVVVDLGKLRVDDVVLLGAARRARATRAAISLLIGGLLVHRFAEFHRSLGQRIGLGLDRGRVIALERFLEVGHRVLDRAPFALANL